MILLHGGKASESGGGRCGYPAATVEALHRGSLTGGPAATVEALHRGGLCCGPAALDLLQHQVWKPLETVKLAVCGLEQLETGKSAECDSERVEM